MIVLPLRLSKVILSLDMCLGIFIVGHVPRNISVLCDLFLKKGGTILCIITGPHQYSRDLEKGGLDVPCKLIFSGLVKEDFKQKVQSLLQKAPKLERSHGATLAVTSPIEQTQQNDTQATSSSSSSTSQEIVLPIQRSVSSVSSTPTIEIDDTGSSNSDESNKEEVYPKKRAHIDANKVVNLLEEQWLQVEKCILTSSDWMLLIEGKRLNDHHINFAKCLQLFLDCSSLCYKARNSQSKLKVACKLST